MAAERTRVLGRKPIRREDFKTEVIERASAELLHAEESTFFRERRSRPNRVDRKGEKLHTLFPFKEHHEELSRFSTS